MMWLGGTMVGRDRAVRGIGRGMRLISVLRSWGVAIGGRCSIWGWSWTIAIHRGGVVGYMGGIGGWGRGIVGGWARTIVGWWGGVIGGSYRYMLLLNRRVVRVRTFL